MLCVSFKPQQSNAQEVSISPVKVSRLEDSISPPKILMAESIDTTLPSFLKKNSGSLVGKLGPSLENMRPAEITLVVNGFIISDQEAVDFFRHHYTENIKSAKFFDSAKGLRKYGVASKDGILVIKMRKKVLIDLEKINVGKTETNK